MRYPSGIASTLPDQPGGDPKVWAAQVVLAASATPLGQSAPCMNPECGGPVDYIPTHPGTPPRYCSSSCRNRASALRVRARQQLDVIDRLLAATKGKHDVPRDVLLERARQLTWWLDRLDGPTPK